MILSTVFYLFHEKKRESDIEMYLEKAKHAEDS